MSKKKSKQTSKPEKPKELTRSENKESFIKTFGIMSICIFIVFSFVYQSVQKVYLTYEIADRDKIISDLEIKLMESQAENEKLQTNENIERVASEKLGMSYEKSDKVIIVRENAESQDTTRDEESLKIRIFMQSLYDEAYNQLKQFDITKFKEYFDFK